MAMPTNPVFYNSYTIILPTFNNIKNMPSILTHIILVMSDVQPNIA